MEARRQTDEVKKHELIRLLCHYLIYVGQKISLLPPAWHEKAVIDLAESQWNKRPGFIWQLTETDLSEMPTRTPCRRILPVREDTYRLPWEDLISWPEDEGMMPNS